MMKVVVVLIPAPGRGHLTPTVEFAKRLAKHNRFAITILSMSLPFRGSYLPYYIESIAASGLDITLVELPPVDLQFEKDQNPVTFISHFIEEHKPQVLNAITQLTSSSPSPIRIAGLILDFFCTSMIDVAKELGIPPYIYFTSGAGLLSLMLYLPTLDTKIDGEYKDYQGEIEIPGWPPLSPLILPQPLEKRDDGYGWFVHHGRRYRETNGIILNTFSELEMALLDAINEGRCLPDHPTPPIYPVGPIVCIDDDPKTSLNPCIEWLNQQPRESVIFLCFGSMGAFLEPQVKEIAYGLEKSGHRFLWCLRVRLTEGASMPTDANLAEVLPEGFLERTKERGLVWPSWVPQTAILAHQAVGGFVSHCGWNSFLESLWHGVPLLAWPLYAEQKMNAFQLVKDSMAVELRLDYKGEGVVSKDEVERGVRCLMEEEEGRRVRERVKEMSERGRAAVEEGGSSFASLKRLTQQFMEGAM